MESRIALLLFFSMSLSFLGCKNKNENFENYLKYLNEPENGLMKERSIAGVKFTVKYLPPDYLIHHELKFREEVVDSSILMQLKNKYANSLIFLLIISPAQNEKFDVTKVGVSNYKEFDQRIMELSFGMQENLQLEFKEHNIQASIAQLERVYALKKGRHINIAFDKSDLLKQHLINEDIYLIYHDRIFQTGINKFHFKSSDLNRIPDFIQ